MYCVHVTRYCVQDLHSMLKLQFFIKRHNARLSPVITDQNLTKESVIEPHESIKKQKVTFHFNLIMSKNLNAAYTVI